MLRFFSPAKINLFFRVLGARPDGYHEVATLMQTINLGDTLFIEPALQDSLTCTDPTLPCDHSNLILKAAQLFREKSKIRRACKFHLAKHIPVEAGLGGGSSNAATVLWALNQMTGEKIELKLLKKWAAALGSDVPFFLSCGTAHCTGRGELVHEKPPLKNQSFWIAKPKEKLSTPEVYKNVDLAQCTSVKQGDYFNDLESSAFKLVPTLPALKQQLLSLGFHTVVMTGSGTAFFCLGQVQNPMIDGVQFFNVEFIQRKEGAWYT